MIKTCQNCKKDFVIEPDDFAFYEKIQVPPPTFCWKCRFQRRLAWRNERNPFWNVSPKSGKRFISMYPPDSGIIAYDEKEWRADDWDGIDYGIDYDFSRNFFEQLRDLEQEVPHSGPHTEDNVNCEYLINSGWSKNCYLVCNSTGAEDSAYSNAIDYCKSCFDDSHITKSERCYGSFWIWNCYQTHFSTRSAENASSWFLFGCKGMTNCFGCVNMMNKSYYIFNKSYSKEAYEEKISEMKLNTWLGLMKAKEAAFVFSKKFPYAYLNGLFNSDVTGEYVSESKNVRYGYLVIGARDVKYGQYLQVPGAEDSMDITIWGDKNVRAYENVTSGLGVTNSKFCVSCWAEVIDSEYCLQSRGISNCFGCVGLKKKKYCIFNKQYSQEEYGALRRKIIQHMNDMPYRDKKGREYRYGEFFPIEFSPLGYNISLVNEHFPLTKEEALKQGFSWYQTQEKKHEVTLQAKAIPDAIEDAPDTITKEILECIDCSRAYRVIPMELSFLRQEKLPIPRQCIDCRHNERISQRAKAFFYHRECNCAGAKSKDGVYTNIGTHKHGTDHCPVEFETAYPPEDEKIIYCHDCFWQEID